MISKKGIARFRLIAERQCLKFSTCKVADWETIVGLEMHAQMASKQKLFSESLVSSDSLANSQVSSFDRALPGYLPVW